MSNLKNELLPVNLLSMCWSTSFNSKCPSSAFFLQVIDNNITIIKTILFLEWVFITCFFFFIEPIDVITFIQQFNASVNKSLQFARPPKLFSFNHIKNLNKRVTFNVCNKHVIQITVLNYQLKCINCFLAKYDILK